MRIAFISSESFMGRLGGFGKLVRVVGKELARKGYDVYVITWKETYTRNYMEFEGIKVLSYPFTYTSRSALRHIVDYNKVVPLIRKVDADVYISIECRVETYIAEKVMPGKKHVIWFQDPFDEKDYKVLGSIDPNYKFNKLKFETTRILYTMASRCADLLLTQAKYYIPKIAKLYYINLGKTGLTSIVYLPNPIEYIPNESSIKKAKEPTVCFLGRMDPQKRYWLFFQLAKAFPEVKFVAMGRPNEIYRKLYEKIVDKYRTLNNLEIKGFVNEKEKYETLSKSWILCLPSLREGLPLAFLEALAHRCALLSSVNPDKIVSRFGYYAYNEDFEDGLLQLLKNETWREKGAYGYEYIRENNRLDRIIEKLLHLIENLKKT